MGFIGGMFKVPKHRKFDYIPQHYDPQKEELEERLAPYKEGGKSADMAKAGIKTGFKRRVNKNPSYNISSKSSTIRLVAIICVLIVLTVLFLKSSLIADFVKAMES